MTFSKPYEAVYIILWVSEWVSEWVSAFWLAHFQRLYHGENKLIFNEMMMRAALY
jgi:hypothetical protein